MKKNKIVKLLGYSLLIGGLLVSVPQKHSVAATTTTATKTNSHSILKVKNHSLNIPKGWTIKKGLDSFVFVYKGKQIGGLDSLRYNYKQQKIENLLPNHSKVLYKKKLKGYAYQVEKVSLEIESPPGSGKLTKVSQIHYYIIDKEKSFAYDLYFLNGVTSTTVDKILKSFK